MPNNITAPAEGAILATSEIGGAHYPKNIITDGSGNEVDFAILATRLAAIAGSVDGLEGFVDGLEALLGTGNTSLAAIAGSVDGLEGLVDGLEALLGPVATEATLAALSAKLPASLGAKAVGSSLSIVPATAADMASDTEVKRTGTRAYTHANGQRITAGATSSQSAAISATEVLVHANGKCFIEAGANPAAITTGTSIPLEAGEKFHMRITSGHKIAAIRDTVDGYVFIIPVA